MKGKSKIKVIFVYLKYDVESSENMTDVNKMNFSSFVSTYFIVF